MSATQYTTKHVVDELVNSYQRVPMLIIATHPDRSRIGERAVLMELHNNSNDYLSRVKPEFAKNGNAGRALLDEFISRSPIIFQSESGGRIKLRAHSTKTTVTIAGRGIQDEYVLQESELDNGVVIGLNHRIVLLLKNLPLHDSTVDDNDVLFGISSDIRAIRQRVERLAGMNLPVMIRGAAGVGKQQAAYAIHQASERRTKPFISVNLAAIHDAVAEAELFGSYRNGSRQPGYFEQADGGTIVLEDIEDASSSIHRLLYTVLQSQSVVPVGSDEALSVSCRIMLTSHHDPNTHEENSILSMLIEKLSAYQLFIPPLAERREDIGLLFDYFVREQWRKLYGNRKDDIRIPGELMNQLLTFHWPGNVRQLRNVARQVVIDSREQEQLHLDPQLLSMLKPATSGSWEEAAEVHRKPNSISRDELLETLSGCRFELQATAKKLGISRASVYQLIQRFEGVRTAQDLSEDEIKQSYDENRADTEKMMWDLQVSQIGLRRRLKSLGYTI
ncbi:sigma-54-dependent transcriptional regulator [Idiomarina sp. HP20-50]|uniref:sigma-54-dependent transcriptional regulator n=1 Tax=Idiomarina sp. HP20-50 TaxID=3070813 RepID=UPI00294B8886|nr:sigma 54-interacting transcriptional regulator [Idiomarina sp. HP20-50]MDV6315658.1 sigma 54-interacting transcriptional regulator [Idiomarina sp. HP20-50]